MELVKPSEKYKESFLRAAAELRNDPSRKYGIESEVTAEKFDNYLQTLLDYENGLNLPENFVPATDFWLIDKGEYIGRVSIRHKLNESLKKFGGHIGYTIKPSKRKLGYGTKILELALTEAKKLGLEKIQVTCDKDNIGSKKIIEKNGGSFVNERVRKDGNITLTYWIDLS